MIIKPAHHDLRWGVQAAKLSGGELSAYLRHLEGGIFLGNTPPEGLGASYELLRTKADAWHTHAQQEQQPRQHQRQEHDGELHHGEDQQREQGMQSSKQQCRPELRIDGDDAAGPGGHGPDLLICMLGLTLLWVCSEAGRLHHEQ